MLQMLPIYALWHIRASSLAPPRDDIEGPPGSLQWADSLTIRV